MNRRNLLAGLVATFFGSFFLKKSVAKHMEDTFCVWTADGINMAECGYEFDFNDDGPVENGWNFCPSCGRKMNLSSS